MPELKHKAAQEEPIRVIERDAAGANGPDLRELERRVSSLQSDITQLTELANNVRQAGEGNYLRLTQPHYFGALNRFGPVPPGSVPQVPHATPGAPLFGYGAPAYNLPPEAVTMRDFSSLPSVTRQPGVNIVDAGVEFILTIELPATKKEDIELLGSDRSLTVSAEVRPDTETQGTVLLGEVTPTIYRRTIHLPVPCNTGRCKATLKDGVLTLAVPKRDPSNGMRRIDVAYG